MADSEGGVAGPGQRDRSRVAVAGAIGGGLVLVALAAGWIERVPIVAHFAGDALADRHVRASYRIAAVGPFAQRLENVRIGDPAHPDLTARSVEIRLGYDLHGPHVVGLRADGVRLSARVVDGRLSLGALDRLLPATSGTRPVALPKLSVDLTDTLVTLATPAGTVRAAVSGAGRLSDGFRGRVVATSGRLAFAGCTATDPRADLAVQIARGRPRIEGPLALAALRCPGSAAIGPGQARLALTFAPTLDHWVGDIGLDGFAGTAPGVRFGALAGGITMAGDRHRIAGDVRVSAAGVATAQGRAARLHADGRYRFAPGVSGLVYAGDVALADAAVDPATRRRVAAATTATAATPLGPLAARAGSALAALLAKADADATVALTAGGPAGTTARLRRLVLTGANGATVRVDAGAGIGRSVREPGWRVDGHVVVQGGGLPEVEATLVQDKAGAPVRGVARLAPYAAGGARLALTPVRFQSDGGATRFATVATLDGPLADGRVAGLTVPIAGRAGPGGLVLGADCVPVGFARLAVSGMVLSDGRFRLCGIDGAPIVATARDGSVRAGAAIADLALAGRSGSAPLTLAAKAVQVTAAGLSASAVAARLGRGDAVTRLDIGTLDGRFVGGIGGRFADTGGQIARVPLVLSAAAGDWRLAGGVLTLGGALTVSDEATPARFKPMAAKAVALRLAGGRIAATGTLDEPTTGAHVADIVVAHDLASGRGGATLTVPALVFDKRLQPEMLTPVTLGVIANVAGTVTGRGRIDWDVDGVTSTGDFATDHADLAAAFGPVTGIAGTIHFTDLLGLQTPPHQSATIAEINPGVAVDNGILHYQLLAGNRVAVEDARWPFAGGTLTLEPSVLAFEEDSERHLTFRLDHLDAAAFVQQLDLPNLAATGVFDGQLPMVFDAKGGRIAGGSIVARPPGGTIAYVGELSQEQLGAMGKLAFDALKAIRYSSLSIGLDGRLDGEIVSHVAFEGVRQATPDASFAARLIHNLPFRFNIAVRAPFRSLLGTARSYVDPSLLLQGGLVPGDTVSVPPTPIQPAESDPVR